MVLTDADGVAHVSGLHAESVASAGELLAALQTTAQRRETLTTARNDASSRSHAFYRLRFQREGEQDGCITFVDLAGAHAARHVVLFQATQGVHSRVDTRVRSGLVSV